MKLPRLNFRTVFWTAVALGLALALVWTFRPRPVLVDVAQATRGEMVVAVEDEGRARARDVYVVSAPASGRLVRVEMEAGDAVSTGDVVAILLPPASAPLDPRTREQAQATVSAAEAALAAAADRVRAAQADADLASVESRRVETLAADGFAPVAARDRARRDLQAAEAALAAARADSNRAEAELAVARARLAGPGAAAADGVLPVTAPVSGRVLRVVQESETVLAPGAPILEIADPADLEVVAEFLSSEAARIAEGARAQLANWGGEPDPLPGRVRRIEPSGFTKVSALGVEEQRVNVIIELDDPRAAAGGGLGDGWRVDAAVEVWRAADALTVPVATLFRSNGGWAVFRVEGGRARLRGVEVGRENGVAAQIMSGLEAGDRLVLYPGERIADGVRVRPRG